MRVLLFTRQHRKGAIVGMTVLKEPRACGIAAARLCVCMCVCEYVCVYVCVCVCVTCRPHVHVCDTLLPSLCCGRCQHISAEDSH